MPLNKETKPNQTRIRWVVCILKSQRIRSVSCSWTDSGLCRWHSIMFDKFQSLAQLPVDYLSLHDVVSLLLPFLQLRYIRLYDEPMHFFLQLIYTYYSVAYCYNYFSPLRILHTMSPGLFSVFSPMLIMLSFWWSTLVPLFPSIPVPLARWL